VHVEVSTYVWVLKDALVAVRREEKSAHNEHISRNGDAIEWSPTHRRADNIV